MIRFGKMTLKSERGGPGTTVYGWICEYGLIEAFATHPSASGTSEAMLGKFHSGWVGLDIEEIDQKQFNAAFIIWPSAELDGVDATLSLGELMTKYPLEEKL